METMQDDCYMITIEDWTAGNQVEWTKKEFEGRLIPKQILIKAFFEKEQESIANLEANRDNITTQLEEIEVEHSGEDGFFSSLDKVNKANVNAELKEVNTELKTDKTNEELLEKRRVLEFYLKLAENQAEANKKLKEAKAELDDIVLNHYKSLTETEIKTLVVDDKWMASIEQTVKNEMQRISQRLTQRINELAERYEMPLPNLMDEINEWERKVNSHLTKMGFTWK